MSCGGADVDPGAADTPPAIRLHPNPASLVVGAEPLVVYFETYHLTPADDGLAHFELEYTVRSLVRDRRALIQRMLAPRKALPEISARRSETQLGEIRRQFVDVPVRALPPGPYQLQVVIRDQTAGTEAAATTRFEKR